MHSVNFTSDWQTSLRNKSANAYRYISTAIDKDNSTDRSFETDPSNVVFPNFKVRESVR